MAAGVHANRSPQRSRHPDRPLESGQPGCGALAGQHGKPGCRPGPEIHPLDLHPVESRAEPHGEAVEPRVSHQQVGALAHQQHVGAVSGNHLGHGGNVGGRGHRRPDPCCPADPVGGVGADRALPVNRLWPQHASQILGQLIPAGCAHCRPPSIAIT